MRDAPGFEIVRAVVVIRGAAQLLVTIAVAGGDQGVMDARRRVLRYGHDRPPMVGDEAVPDLWTNSPEGRTAVFHRHELADVEGIEGSGIDHLLAESVDDRDGVSAYAANEALTGRLSSPPVGIASPKACTLR
jgi:hypothetical protein